jgi:hypothetical protein
MISMHMQHIFPIQTDHREPSNSVKQFGIHFNRKCILCGHNTKKIFKKSAELYILCLFTCISTRFTINYYKIH